MNYPARADQEVQVAEMVGGSLEEGPDRSDRRRKWKSACARR